MDKIKIKKYPQYKVDIFGVVYGKQGGVLVTHKNRCGYKMITLNLDGGKKKTCYVHRLVLESFIEKPNDGLQACHNNGDRCDNRLENLRWDTPGNNFLDRKEHGTWPKGVLNSNCKITESQAILIKKLLKTDNHKHREIAEIFKVPTTLVANIACGK